MIYYFDLEKNRMFFKSQCIKNVFSRQIKNSTSEYSIICFMFTQFLSYYLHLLK